MSEAETTPRLFPVAGYGRSSGARLQRTNLFYIIRRIYTIIYRISNDGRRTLKQDEFGAATHLQSMNHERTGRERSYVPEQGN